MYVEQSSGNSFRNSKECCSLTEIAAAITTSNTAVLIVATESERLQLDNDIKVRRKRKKPRVVTQ